MNLHEPLERNRLHEQIAERIRDYIQEKSLKPGTRLPTERTLAGQLDVSRVVVREALVMLNTQGLVKIVPGSGTYVKELSPQDATESFSRFLKMTYSLENYENLIELRRTLETEIAGLVAQRATPDDIAAMQAAIEGMIARRDDPDSYVRHDLEFHNALAAATHNELYAIVLEPITNLLIEFRLTNPQFQKDRGTQRAIERHQEILERVKERNAEGARDAMRRDLDSAAQLMEALRAYVRTRGGVGRQV